MLPLIRIDQHRRLDFLDFSGKPLTWFVIGLILHTIGLIYVHFSPDSMHFVDLGRNFARGLGLVTYNQNLTSESIPDWITFFPALYPVLLSIGFKLGMGAAGAARIVSLTSFVIIFLSVYAFGRRLVSRELGVLAAALWVILVSRWSISLYAWSDPPFVAFSLLSLLVMMKSLQKEEHLVYYFALAGLLSGLAASTRLIGVTSLPCGILAAILSAFRSDRDRKRLWCAVKLTAALLIGFIVPMSTWMIYNRVMAGYFMKALRIPSETSLFTNVATMAKGIFFDLWPVFALTLMTYLLVGGFSLKGFLSYFPGKGRLSEELRKDMLLIMSCWIICYCGLLIVIASIVDIYDMRYLNTRLFVPVYPFLIVILSAVAYLTYSSRFKASRIPRVIYTTFFLIALLLAGKHLSSEIKLYRELDFGNCELYEWIGEETNPDDLFIGRRVWHVRFYTGRPVLGSGYPEMPPLTPEAVTGFLKRFEKNYKDAYFVLRLERGEKFSLEDLEAYQRAGFDLHRCGVFDSYEKEVEVYQIVKIDQETISPSLSEPSQAQTGFEESTPPLMSSASLLLQ